MGHLYDKRENAEKHPVAKGDKLADLADLYKSKGGDFPPDLTWEKLAAFNWATSAKREVLRALCERIGSSDPNAIKDNVDPDTLELDPAFGPTGDKEILIPKLWKADGLDVKKTHTVKVKKHLPASAIGIKSLDKWFVPELETCDVEYVLEGEKTYADQVDFEVYGSQYCSLTDWDNGLPKFAALADVPVYTRPGLEPSERTEPKIDDWSGEANCKQGLLATQSGGARTVNVAFSPYTAALRYFRKATGHDDDKTARIDLGPFWPQFGTDGKPLPDTCKIKWTVKGSDRLKFGLLQIMDKTGSVVILKPLAAADLAKDAAKEYAWNGKHFDTTDASADNMPYRVKIDAHTDIDETDGLGVAAMHTEVRLFVDKDTHALDLDPYVAATDKISLDLSIADLYHKDVDPVRGSDGKIWTKFELAKAGFHPGPVSNGTTNAHFESALNEFQRSVPKHPRGVGGYERLLVTAGGNDDIDTKDALENLLAARKRPWFGKPADRSDWPDPTAQPFKNVLRDPTGKIVLWVDDRNWYTDGTYWHHPLFNAVIGVTAQNLADGNNHAANLGNTRGSYLDGDLRVGYDANDIARPWIPLQVDFRLLSKGKSLDEAVAEDTPDRTAKMRKSIGPLRVDWTFDEIEQTAPENVTVNTAAVTLNLPVLDTEVENTLAALYNPERNRTRIALRYSLDQTKAEYDRVDVIKHSKYYNAPEACGGIRPATTAQYFSKAFGVDDDSLVPWKAKTSTRESVYTVVHDDVNQPSAQLFPKRRGRAGIYFNPSRVAGDGYQVRAQVQFESAPDYAFPNLAVLKTRYKKLPQAQTAQFRLWRKTSIRGYVCWSPTNTWTAPPALPRANFPLTGPSEFRKYYTGCHIHIVNELGAANNALEFPPNTLFTLGTYRTAVQSCLPIGDPRRNNAWITLDPQNTWPWSAHAQVGLPEPAAVNVNGGPGQTEITGRSFMLFLNYAFRITPEIVSKIESLSGMMRGHVIVEFQTTPIVYSRDYQCATCHDQYTYVERTNVPGLNNTQCPTPGCIAGRLWASPQYRGWYVCSGGLRHQYDEIENSIAGGILANIDCPDCGPPETLSQQQIQRELYRCNTCNFEAMFPEPGPRGSHQNDACPCQCGGILLSRNQPLAMGANVDIEPANGIGIGGYSGGAPVPGLPSASCGFPAGVAWNFLGDTDLWAHELGHNRYYEHAGNAPPEGDPNHEHDSEPNTVVNWGALPRATNWPRRASNIETLAYNQTWDRACLMTYVTDVGTYDNDRDMPCFCFKCVLKNRGWKLHAVPAIQSPPGDLRDP